MRTTATAWRRCIDSFNAEHPPGAEDAERDYEDRETLPMRTAKRRHKSRIYQFRKQEEERLREEAQREVDERQARLQQELAVREEECDRLRPALAAAEAEAEAGRVACRGLEKEHVRRGLELERAVARAGVFSPRRAST